MISFAATPQAKEAQQARAYTDPSAGAPPSRRSGSNAPYVDLGHWNKVFTDQTYFDSIAKQKGMTEGAKVSLHGDDYVYRQAMIGYLADTRKVPLDDMRKIFDAEKEGFAKTVLGKQTASAREMFDWQKQQFERSNEKKAAADQILQGVIRRSLEDALSGGDTPFVESVGKDINAASEMFDDEEKSRLWEKAEELDIKIRASQDRFAPEARFIFDALQQSTGQKTGFGAPDMRDMAARFAKLPDNQRKAIYELAGGFAQITQTDKGFWYQMAESLGRGASDIVERVPRNFREQTLRGQLRLLNGQQPLFRAAGVAGAEFSQAGPQGAAPITPEEREEAKAKIEADLGILKVERELRDLAERVVDPIKMTGVLPEIIEEGLYGAARSIPYTAVAAVPYVGVPAVASALFSSNYDRIMLEYPDLDPDKAALIAAISAPIEAGLERMKVNTITGRLPVFGGLVKRLQHPNQRNITRIAIGGAGIVAEQNVQEIVQNATFPFVQTIAAALDADMPDYDWEERLAGMPRELAVQFVALLPLSLMGVGALSYREISRGENYLKSKADLEKAGYNEEQIDRINGAESAEAAQAALVEEHAKRDPKLVKAAAQRVVDEVLALREKSNPAALPRLEKQGADYVVLSPEGKELARTTDQTAAEQALVSARRETVQREMRDVHTGINEAVAFIQKVNEARQRGEDVAKVIREEAPRTLLTDYEANPTQENLDRLFETVRAFGQDINEPAELANFPVTGSNQGALREGIWRSIIRINEGADGTIVMREFAQDNLKRAIAEGRTTLDFVRQQLNDILPQIDSDRMDRQLRTETDTDVIEAFSDVALAYFRGSIREEQIPAGLRGIMRRLAIVTRDIFRRAYNLARLRAEGKLDRDFEALLAEAVGVDQQALVDRSREKTAQEVAPDGRGADGLTDEERFALEQELQAEMERDAAEAAGEGGIDILDAVREAGGLPAKTSKRVYQYSGELQRIREASKGGNAIGVKGAFNLFRKNAPDFDTLIKDLQTMGFNQIATPSDLFDMIERRITTGRPIYGYEAATMAATAQAVGNYSIGSRAQPDVERNVVTLPDVTISGPANYSIAAWHGSPSRFDKFDLGKIGTGEGAQVYGWGLYFANKREVADGYRRTLAGLTKLPEIEKRKGKYYAVDRFDGGSSAVLDGPFKTKKQAQAGIEKYDASFGSLYQVNIESDQERFLDFDKPLSEQSAFVKNAIGSAGLPQAAAAGVNRLLQNNGRAAIDDVMSFSGSAFYGNLTNAIYALPQFSTVLGDADNEQEAVSKMLLSLGIVGIRYFDQGSRATGPTETSSGWQVTNNAGTHSFPTKEKAQQFIDEGATYNYVIFDDSLIKILTRNGEQISVEQAAQETQNYSIASSGTPRLNLEAQLKELQAGEPSPVDTSKTFWLIASSSGDIVDILDNEQDATSYFQTTASTGEWLWEYKDGLRTEIPLLKRGVAERRADGYIDTVRQEQESQGRVFYGADTSPETATSAGEIPSHTPDGQPWAGQEESVVYHGGRLFDPQGTDQGGYGQTQTLKPRRPYQTYLYSISTQREIDRVGAALNRLDRSPLERVKIYEKAQEKFLRVMADNREMLAGMQDGDLAQMRRTQILQALGELDGIISVLPPEVRSKIGGYTQLAKVDPMDVFKGDQKVSEVRGMSGAIISAWMREGLNIGEAQKKTELPAGYRAERNLDPTRADRAIADVFIGRIERINRVMEQFLRDEYNDAAVELFKRAKPQRSGAGEKPKGKLGADVHDLFDTLKEATEWSAEEARAYADGQWARIENGELNPYEETRAMMAAQMVPLFADWANADSSQRAAAVTMGKDVLNRAYKGEQQRIIAQRTKRGYDRTDLSKDAGVSAEDDKARQEALKKENSLPAKWESAMLNLLNFDQVLRYIFGNNSKIAQQISDRQRKADNAKSDDIAALSDEWAAFLSRLGGGEMQGQQLLFELSRMDNAIDGVPYSQNQLVAITMMWMQPKGRQHMEGFMDSDGQPAGKWHYNQDFVNKAEKLLRPEAKAIRLYLLAKYDAEYEAINKVYRKVYGLNLPKNQFYSPLVVESIRAPAQAGIDPVTGGVFAAGANSPSALRSRGGAIAQPVFRDAVQTYFGHMLQMAHWKAYAEFNGEVAALLGHRDTRNVVKGKAGEQAATVMNNWLQYFNQGGNKDAANHLAINQMINRMTGNFATMALFGRVSTLALQVTQLGAASAKMPAGAYLSRFGKLMSGRLGWRTALDSDYIQRRIKDMPPAVALAMQGLRSDKPSVIREAARRVGWLISGFDGFFTAGTYAIVYDYQLSQATQNGMGGQEAADYAREATERIVDEIAQPTRAGARSIFEVNTTNPVARAVWAFSSEARKNFGLAVYAGAAGRSGEFGKALFYVMVLNGLVSTVIRTAFRDLRDDDDEEVFDEKNWGWNRMAAMLISDPLYGFPVIGEAIESAIFNAFGVYTPSGPLFDIAPAVPAAKRMLTEYPSQVLEGEAEFRDIVRDVNRILSTAGLFNNTIAGAAAISNLVKDTVEAGDNILGDDQ